jgi:hypothetical protein
VVKVVNGFVSKKKGDSGIFSDTSLGTDPRRVVTGSLRTFVEVEQH